MRYLSFLIILLSALIFNGNFAMAGHGPFSYFFPSCDEDFDRPYMNKAEVAYNSDWEYPDWTPESWMADGRSAGEILDGFYRAGIVSDLKVDRGNRAPFLEVGQGFLQLSGREQRRVVAFFDYAHGISANGDALHVVLKRKCTPLGVYTQDGLQLH